MDQPKDFFPFAEVLQRFRKRAKLTQQELAKRIGANRSTVSFWERGEYVPETLTMVLEIARVLKLSEEEKRLLIEARFGTASILPLHNLPEYNPYFTGREEILRSLHAHLTTGKHVALIQTKAISGLGGIGKTQVAIEYAYRSREHYHDILWAPADSRETLMASYLTLARHLGLREREERDQHRVVEAVKRWLWEHKNWLLILDNIEDLGLVREYVPTPRQGAVILTTRREETQPVAQAIVLDTMPEEEGILFLLRRIGHLAVDASLHADSSHIEAARAIVHAVGGLPLALDQAGAYIAETKCSLSDYLGLFKSEQKALLQRRGTVPSDHPQSVTGTFSLAFKQVQKKNAAAIELLKLCAFLAPDAIPLEVIIQGAIYLGTVLEPVAGDTLQLDQALEILQAYSLVRRDRENRTLSIHRLVQAVLKNGLNEQMQLQWAERTVRAVNATFPKVEFAIWSRYQECMPHALACAQLIEHYTLMFAEAAQLLRRAGAYMRDHAQYSSAEALLQHSISVCEQVLGSENSQTVQSLHDLGKLYYYQGKYGQAEALFQRALAIREQVQGPEHPDTAASLDNLALLYRDQGKYQQAEPLFLRSLAIFEQVQGPEHPNTAENLNNLAVLYRDQGKYAEAEPLFQRSLAIAEQVLGSEHPGTTIVLNNLAVLYRDQGKYAEAEPLFLRSLAISEQVHGSDHPQTAACLNNLAVLYRDQGKYAEAEPLFQRALTTREKMLGPEHPGTVATRKDSIDLQEKMKQTGKTTQEG